MLSLALAAATLAAPRAPTPTPFSGENMNGAHYLLQATPKGGAAVNGSTAWSTEFKNYPGGVEYFEVLAGPVKTTYSEVFWTGLPAVQLPAELVQRFDGKVMAVVGFEADQVRRKGDKDFDGSILKEDVSVPINVAYNHHYGATLVGKGSKMTKMTTAEAMSQLEGDKRAMHPGPEPGFVTVPVEYTPSASGIPTSLPFGYSNGGEFRKTYHGLAPPFAQLVESPHEIHISPMQIDTWNREKMNLTGGQIPKYVAGPAPKHSFAPTSGVDSIYSGLLECPLTTRLRKQITGGGWNDTFVTSLAACGTAIASAESCFAVGKEIGLCNSSVSTTSVSSASLPAGCSVQVNATGQHLFWNSNSKSAASCDAGVDEIAGQQESLVTLGLTVNSGKDLVSIKMSGPSANWFGVGFNTQFMSNSPYAITVDATTGKPTERVLGEHVGGIVLNASLTVVSNVVKTGTRTIVMTRALKGLTPHHHSFSAAQLSMGFISALGASPSFSYHKTKTAATLALWPSHTHAPTPDPTAGGGTFGFFGGLPATGKSCPCADEDAVAAGCPCKFRTTFAGTVGYEIYTARPLTVTSLGRSGAKLGKAQTVTIYDATIKKAMASVEVGPAGTVESGYTYVALKAPVHLPAGSYFVTQTCTTDTTDEWPDTNVNADSALSYIAKLGNGVFRGGVGVPTEQSTAGRWAGIATFKATVAAHPEPKPPAPDSSPATCVCSVPAAPFGQGKGKFLYLETGESLGFPPRCNLGSAAPSAGGHEGEDYSVMKNHNPTCDIRTYVGGLSTCHHGWHLLDAEQEIPWQDQPITYYMKYRLYFQPYTPAASAATTAVAAAATATAASHINAFDITWSIAGATGEYDVPVCAKGTPVEECKHEISGGIVPPGKDYHFVAAHYHCHAPTCLSMEIWNNRTGELLCKEVPYHGGRMLDGDQKRFDEEGYIAQRVCLWGLHPPFEKPPFVSGEPLWVKSVTNNSYGHHGEMALPQMLLASLPNATW